MQFGGLCFQHNLIDDSYPSPCRLLELNVNIFLVLGTNVWHQIGTDEPLFIGLSNHPLAVAFDFFVKVGKTLCVGHIGVQVVVRDL